jgi:hypothetical protein
MASSVQLHIYVGCVAVLIISTETGCSTERHNDACSNYCQLGFQCDWGFVDDAAGRGSEACVEDCEGNFLADWEGAPGCTDCYKSAASCEDFEACGRSLCPSFHECAGVEVSAETHEETTWSYEWKCAAGQMTVMYGDAACKRAAQSEPDAVGCVEASAWNGACGDRESPTGRSLFDDSSFRCNCGAACTSDRCLVWQPEAQLRWGLVYCDGPSPADSVLGTED